MKVLVLGASGYLGLPICTALLREGATVIGQTRSTATAKKLEAEEIIPRLAEPADPDSWRHLVAEVDVVIDAVGGSDIQKLSKLILETVVEEARKSRPQGPPLAFIYTSGTWVHGDHLEGGPRSDRTPVSVETANLLTSWRIPHEQAVLAAKSSSLITNVVRPSLLYGRSGSITAEWFASAHTGSLVAAVKQEARIATCHVDDCAALYALVAQKALLVHGIIFDASNAYPESLSTILTQLAVVAKAEGPKFTEPTDDFHRAITSSNVLRPSLGGDLLGWQARKAPLAEGIQQYYSAWAANVL